MSVVIGIAKKKVVASLEATGDDSVREVLDRCRGNTVQLDLEQTPKSVLMWLMENQDLNANQISVISSVVKNGNSQHATEEPGTPIVADQDVVADQDDLVPLSGTERQQFYRLIVRRQDTILKALNDEMQQGKEDGITEMIRRDKGLIYTPVQLTSLISGIDEQIKAEKEKHMASERDRLELQRSEIIEEFEEKEQELRKRHKEEYKVLLDEKKDKLSKVREELATVEENVIKQHAGPLLAKKNDYQAKLAHTKQLEMEVKAIASQRIAIVRQSRGRLEHTIRDATGRALESLLMEARTRGNAKELLSKIPTVSDAVRMCSSPEGIEDFFRQLDPTMPRPQALPAPTIDVEAVVETPEADRMQRRDERRSEDFEEANADREWQVYSRHSYDEDEE